MNCVLFYTWIGVRAFKKAIGKLRIDNETFL